MNAAGSHHDNAAAGFGNGPAAVPPLKILCVFGENSYGDPARGKTHEFTNFLPALRAAGHQVQLFDSFARKEGGDFAALNLELLRAAAAFRPDVIFLVLMGYEVWTETLDLIRSHSPALTINWGTDDSWKFDQVSRFLAPYLDFHVTTHKAALQRAEALGLKNVLRSQWATSESRLAVPLPSSACKYDVSFVGQLYGRRRSWIEGLRARGIPVAAFGYGSERGAVGVDEVFEIYRSSRISLNFSDAGQKFLGRSRNIPQIKARIFEVTGAGGFLLTQAADDLPDYFRIGEEIDTFADLDELAHKIERYLNRPVVRDRIAHAGQARTCAEHTYQRRFSDLLREALRRVPGNRRNIPWALTAEMLAPHVARHRNTAAIRPLRAVLERPAQAMFGKKRGARAARRLLFEVSRRFLGEHTFSAAGLPGRLFYEES